MKAMRFIASGEARDFFGDSQAKALYDLAERAPQGSAKIYWARRRDCVAAAMVLAYPGRSGFLFYSPVASPGVDRPTLVELLRVVSADAVAAAGLYFVQVILQPTATDDIAVVTEAGYGPLAELLYMKLDLPAPAGGPRSDLAWRDYSQFTEAELGDLIRATYVDSLDCPALSGVRTMDDVLAGHKVSGLFHPPSWWIAQHEGSPGGCILVNDTRQSAASDVVYMGVHWQHRRKGLAAAMLAHAAQDAAARGRRVLTLAVDVRNEPALRLYRRTGFEPIETRLAMAFFRR